MVSDSLIYRLLEQEGSAEEANRLTREQLDIIYSQKWFKMYVPKHLGGLELNLLEAVRLQEALACLDGSLAWTVTLCSGAVYFVGFIDTHLHQEWFSGAEICWGGSGMSSGTASRRDDGFLIRGQWKYATGSPHNTVFTANCQLLDETENPLLDTEGLPEFRSFFFRKDEVKVLEDWDTMGLRSTASNSFLVQNLKVSADRMFSIDPDARTLHASVFRYPFMVFAQFTLGINYLGMMISYFDELHKILMNKAAVIPQDLILAREFMATSKDMFYENLVQTEEKIQCNATLSAHEQERIGKMAGDLVKNGLMHVTKCFPLAGMLGAQPHSRLNRIWRNLFTATQHSIFRDH